MYDIKLKVQNYHIYNDVIGKNIKYTESEIFTFDKKYNKLKLLDKYYQDVKINNLYVKNNDVFIYINKLKGEENKQLYKSNLYNYDNYIEIYFRIKNINDHYFNFGRSIVKITIDKDNIKKYELIYNKNEFKNRKYISYINSKIECEFEKDFEYHDKINKYILFSDNNDSMFLKFLFSKYNINFDILNIYKKY